jgi:hypothetical protein
VLISLLVEKSMALPGFANVKPNGKTFSIRNFVFPFQMTLSKSIHPLGK